MKKRVSIALSTDEAVFLFDLLRNIGNGGPLWERPEEEMEENVYSVDQRQAFWRLLQMVRRATSPPNKHFLPAAQAADDEE